MLGRSIEGAGIPGVGSGILGGVVSAEAEAWKKGDWLATKEDIGKSMYAMAFVGGAIAGSHWLGAQRGGTDKTNARYWLDRMTGQDTGKTALNEVKLKVLDGQSKLTELIGKLSDGQSNQGKNVEHPDEVYLGADIVGRQHLRGLFGQAYGEARLYSLLHINDAGGSLPESIGTGHNAIVTCAPLTNPLAARDVFPGRTGVDGGSTPVWLSTSGDTLVLTKGQTAPAQTPEASASSDRLPPVRLGAAAEVGYPLGEIYRKPRKTFADTSAREFRLVDDEAKEVVNKLLSREARFSKPENCSFQIQIKEVDCSGKEADERTLVVQQTDLCSQQLDRASAEKADLIAVSNWRSLIDIKQEPSFEGRFVGGSGRSVLWMSDLGKPDTVAFSGDIDLLKEVACYGTTKPRFAALGAMSPDQLLERWLEARNSARGRQPYFYHPIKAMAEEFAEPFNPQRAVKLAGTNELGRGSVAIIMADSTVEKLTKAPDNDPERRWQDDWGHRSSGGKVFDAPMIDGPVDITFDGQKYKRYTQEYYLPQSNYESASKTYNAFEGAIAPDWGFIDPSPFQVRIRPTPAGFNGVLIDYAAVKPASEIKPLEKRPMFNS